MTTQAAPHAAGQPGWLEQLTGMRSSKRTFYAEYSRTAAALNRAIQGLESISSALCTTTSGPLALAYAVLEATAGQLEAPWTAMVVAARLLPTAHPPVVVRDPAGALLVGRDALPPELGELVAAVLGGPPPPAATPLPGRPLVVPMVFGGAPVGALIAALPFGRPVDEIDMSILQTLANQAVVALRNACLFEESERLRVAAVRLCDQAERHARDLERRNHQLHTARREQHTAVHERLGLVKELARAAVEQVRAAIFALSSAEEWPAGDLPGALGRLAQGFGRLANLAVTVRLDGTPRLLDPEVEQALYLIAREAIFNVARHARASVVTVKVN